MGQEAAPTLPEIATIRLTRRLVDVQVLRALASIMVVLQHLSLTATLFGLLPGGPTLPFYLGVELFFVISGFVVTRSLFASLEPHPVAFLVRRFWRLTPAIVAFLIFTFLVFALIVWTVGNNPSVAMLKLGGLRDLALQSFYIITGLLVFTPDTLYYFGAMWSLSVEYQFYIAYAGIIGVGSVPIMTARGFKRFLATAATVLFLVIFLGRVLPTTFSPAGYGPAGHLFAYLNAWRFDFLLAGVVLALAVDRYGPIRMPRWLSRSGIGIGIVCVLVLGALCESPISAVKPLHDGILLPVAMVVFVAVVWLAAAVPRHAAEKAPCRTMISVLAWLGDRSYAIYLYQFSVMALVWWAIVFQFEWVFYTGPYIYGLVQAVATFLITVPLAALTYRYVEIPFGARGERWSREIAARSARWPSGVAKQDRSAVVLPAHRLEASAPARSAPDAHSC